MTTDAQARIVAETVRLMELVRKHGPSLAALAQKCERQETEMADLRETNSRLNRRAQIAEAAAQTTIDDCQRQGVSLGRSLGAAGYAMRERERDEARAEVAELRERIEALHTSDDLGFCRECTEGMPCATIRALSPAEEQRP